MRIRTIKPEFWSHPILRRLSESTQLLAIALLNYADDEGYFWADPLLVRSALRPFDTDTATVSKSMNELAAAGYIEVRTHPTHGPIGRIVNFRKHQRVNRPNTSTTKDYFNAAPSVNTQCVLTEDSLNVHCGKGREWKGKEEEGSAESDDSVNPQQVVVDTWNELPEPFPKVRDVTKNRKKALNARLSTNFWRDNWRSGVERIPSSGFLSGKNDRRWIADFDWFIKPDSLAKILEGKYHDRGPPVDDFNPDAAAERLCPGRTYEQATKGKSS